MRGVVAGATLTTGGIIAGCAVDVRVGGVEIAADATGGCTGGGALVVVKLGGGTFNAGGGPPACAALHCASSARMVSIKFRANDLAAANASDLVWCKTRCNGSNLSVFNTATTPVSDRMYSKLVPF